MGIRASIGSPKQAVLLGVLAIVLILAVVRWRPGTGAAPAHAASAAPRTRSAGEPLGEDPASPRAPRPKVKEVTADEVPILRPEDFTVHPGKAGGDTGRDLFELPGPPTRPPAPTPFPPPPPPGDARYIGPLPPPPPTPTPRPPDVTFKFVGTFGPKGHPIAVIQQGDQVYNVRAGDILFDKFVLRSVGYESIEVGFVGFAETETRRIGITP
ncbi:MAG: hypothetical protein ABI968_00570 [Acidobacteriota bacterium]